MEGFRGAGVKGLSSGRLLSYQGSLAGSLYRIFRIIPDLSHRLCKCCLFLTLRGYEGRQNNE